MCSATPRREARTGSTTAFGYAYLAPSTACARATATSPGRGTVRVRGIRIRNYELRIKNSRALPRCLVVELGADDRVAGRTDAVTELSIRVLGDVTFQLL